MLKVVSKRELGGVTNREKEETFWCLLILFWILFVEESRRGYGVLFYLFIFEKIK